MVAPRDADGDVEASGGPGGGLHGSVVEAGDGRHQREAETEPVVAGALLEPGERQEQVLNQFGSAFTITATAVFDYPTIGSLAEYLASQVPELLEMEPAAATASA